jgi:hypothetical protein
MKASRQAQPQYDLEAAVDDAISACDGDLRATTRSLVVANNYPTRELEQAWQQISPGYSRGRRARRRSTGAPD